MDIFRLTKLVEATPENIGDLCGEGLGPFAKFLCTLTPGPANTQNNAIRAFSSFAYLVSNVIGIMSVVAGLWFAFQVIIGGLNWLTSSGDKARLEKAQLTLVHAVIGLTIVLAAYALINLVGKVLGFDLLISNPADFVNKLRFNPS